MAAGEWRCARAGCPTSRQENAEALDGLTIVMQLDAQRPAAVEQAHGKSWSFVSIYWGV